MKKIIFTLIINAVLLIAAQYLRANLPCELQHEIGSADKQPDAFAAAVLFNGETVFFPERNNFSSAGYDGLTNPQFFQRSLNLTRLSINYIM